MSDELKPDQNIEDIERLELDSAFQEEAGDNPIASSFTNIGLSKNNKQYPQEFNYENLKRVALDGAIRGGIGSNPKGKLLLDTIGAVSDSTSALIQDQAKEIKDDIFDLDNDELDKLKFQEQCFLIENYDQISTENLDFAYDNFTCMHGDPSKIVTNLNSHEELKPFVDITPDQLSRLQPQFRLFKTFYKKDGSELADLEFKFDEFADEESLADTITVKRGSDKAEIQQNKVSRGGGVGLEKFDWKYRGVNPAEASKIIEAELTLRFENIYELTKVRLGVASNGEQVEYSFVDLLLPEKKKTTNKKLDKKLANSYSKAPRSAWSQSEKRYSDEAKVYNPNYFSFKVTVGWQDIAGHADADDPRYKELMKALKLDRKTLVLTLTRHNFDFTQEGPIRLTMFANARFDVAARSAESDIFNLYQSRVNLIKNKLTEVNKNINNIKKCKDNVTNKEEREKIKEQFNETKSEIERRLNFEKQRIYAQLMSDIIDRGRVFNVKIPFDQVGLYQDDYLAFFEKTEMRKSKFEGLRRSGLSDDKKNKPDIDITSICGDVGEFFNPDASKVKNKADKIDEAVDASQKDNINVEDQTYNIPFIYFGDILDVGLESMYGTSNPYTKETKVLVGDYTIEDPRTQERVSINLADIPISLNTFKKWYINNVYRKAKETYPAHLFIKDCVEGLLGESLAPSACFYGTNSKAPKVSTTSFTMPAKDGKPVVDPNDCGRVLLERIMNLDIKEKDTTDVTTYYLLYGYDTNPDDLESNYLDDAKRGIFHFGIGEDRGLIERIQFERTDLKYLRESRLVGDEGENAFRRLREVYNANIDMVGNDIYRPGQLLYINPSTLAFGSEKNPNSAGHALGIVGYYQVIDIDNFIESGAFKTKIKAKWVSSGLGRQGATAKEKPSECPVTEAKQVKNLIFDKTKIIAPDEDCNVRLRKWSDKVEKGIEFIGEGIKAATQGNSKVSNPYGREGSQQDFN